ncbi:heterokaryon incompatibility protein-domain-containing protein [Xylaria digitata]|nr:heterokaryon incompatibility protein-domain-containing protein [Xylaria digitata]
MRLINTTKVVNEFTIEFRDRLHEEDDDHEGDGSGNNTEFKYAILSHTWGWQDEKTGKWAHKVDEVTYNKRHEFSDPFDESLHPDKRKAYQKIYYTCRRALDLGYSYVWIDSCCIDKSNSAELTESINSMFRWYSEADLCLVYLVDSRGGATASENGVPDSRRRLYTEDDTPCRWFSRCWTLQELLASRKLEFYDSEWDLIGTLQDQASNTLDEFGSEISKITKVDAEACLGKAQLWEYSVEAKMNWASNRKAGRPEDIAYSLLGLFDIRMPLIYGEGARAAFQRLQLEIIKSTSDLSIFAWHTEGSHQEGQFCSILADSPSQFRFHRRICRVMPESHHTMTNKGIQMTSNLHRVQTPSGERYFLVLQDEEWQSDAIGIFLRKTDYNVFQRVEESLVQIPGLGMHPTTHRATFYITSSPQHSLKPPVLDPRSIYVPSEYEVIDLLPEACWDCENRVLLGKIPCNDGIRALKLSITTPDGRRILVTLLSCPPILAILNYKTDNAISNALFTRAHRREIMNWDELVNKIPEIDDFDSSVYMEGDSVSFEAQDQNQEIVPLLIKLVETPSSQTAATTLEILVDEGGKGKDPNTTPSDSDILTKSAIDTPTSVDLLSRHSGLFDVISMDPEFIAAVRMASGRAVRPRKLTSRVSRKSKIEKFKAKQQKEGSRSA